MTRFDRIVARAAEVTAQLRSVVRHAATDTLAGDAEAREAVAVAGLALEGLRVILDAPVLCTEGDRKPLHSTVPA